MTQWYPCGGGLQLICEALVIFIASTLNVTGHLQSPVVRPLGPFHVRSMSLFQLAICWSVAPAKAILIVIVMLHPLTLHVVDAAAGAHAIARTETISKTPTRLLGRKAIISFFPA
jgi:hypothetical protein